MILAVDVHYRKDFAKVVSIEFLNWSDIVPTKVNKTNVSQFEEYIPGQFYKRELPCILTILELTDLSNLEAIIIDGYVIIDDKGKAGLGKYLFESLDEKIPIIGIAKRNFKDNILNVEKVYRGSSSNPLFVTSIGIAKDLAARRIKNMSGQYRIPNLIRILDEITKEKT